MAAFNSWRSYWDFERAVKRDLRYVRSPEVEAFLDHVLDTAAGRKVTLSEGAVFWRAQLGHDWREEQQGDESFEICRAHDAQ